MPILADQHMHSSFSFDSKTELRDMVESAVKKGLIHINVTEHNDFNYPVSEKFPKGSWDLNVDSYLYDLLCLREEFQDKLFVGFGIEIGMQTNCKQENIILSNCQPYDFIIASNHLVNGVDTYEPVYFEGKTAKQAIEEYYTSIIENIKVFKNFDVLGHLDYIVRTLPGGEKTYNPLDYMDYVDKIFDILLASGKGIEINTQGLWKKGFSESNPGLEILKRYKEKGGEIITVGSDAHTPDGIAGAFFKAEEILKKAGFEYYSVFMNRMPTFLKL